MSSSPPSIAELRAVTQPESLFDRASGEHWVGRLYMRRLSPYVTRRLLAIGLSADAVTALMMVAGILSPLCLTLPGVPAAVAAAAFAQLQVLFDCCDGEVARWRRSSSPAGIYLDRLGHHLTEAGLPAALGVRAAGGWGSLDGWTTVGLAIAVLVLLIKAETHLVHVARAYAGRPLAADTPEIAVPRTSGLQRIRRALGRVPFYRAFVAVEFTTVALVAAAVDAIGGDLDGSRFLLLVLVPVALVTACGHLVAVLTSERLR